METDLQRTSRWLSGKDDRGRAAQVERTKCRPLDVKQRSRGYNIQLKEYDP